jgi:hypothetical protein
LSSWSAARRRPEWGQYARITGSSDLNPDASHHGDELAEHYGAAVLRSDGTAAEWLGA